MAAHCLDYFSLANLRTRCGFGATWPSDTVLTQALANAVTAIERATGQEFVARTKTLTFDGNGRAELPLTQVLISWTTISLRSDSLNEDEALDGTIDADLVLNYGTHRSNTHHDEHYGRRCPRLRFAPTSGRIWPRGPQTVVITGSWGYLEEDDATPEPILDVICDLVQLGKNGNAYRESLMDTHYGAVTQVQNRDRTYSFSPLSVHAMLKHPKVTEVAHEYKIAPVIIGDSGCSGIGAVRPLRRFL